MGRWLAFLWTIDGREFGTGASTAMQQDGKGTINYFGGNSYDRCAACLIAWMIASSLPAS